jgi:hypothetical protein
LYAMVTALEASSRDCTFGRERKRERQWLGEKAPSSVYQAREMMSMTPTPGSAD